MIHILSRNVPRCRRFRPFLLPESSGTSYYGRFSFSAVDPTAESNGSPTTDSSRLNIFGLTTAGLADVLGGIGVPKYRSKQIREFLFWKGVTSFSHMPNMPMDLKRKLPQQFSLYEYVTVLSEVETSGVLCF
jgi:hypothetical protein